jgi:hypothetical protein
MAEIIAYGVMGAIIVVCALVLWRFVGLFE